MTRRAMVYNFYGVPEIRGPDMVETGHRQAAHFGAELIKAAVTDVKKTEDGFRLMTEQGDFHARHVILATGATADLAARIGLESRPATEPRIKTVRRRPGPARWGRRFSPPLASVSDSLRWRSAASTTRSSTAARFSRCRSTRSTN